MDGWRVEDWTSGRFESGKLNEWRVVVLGRWKDEEWKFERAEGWRSGRYYEPQATLRSHTQE